MMNVETPNSKELFGLKVKDIRSFYNRHKDPRYISKAMELCFKKEDYEFFDNIEEFTVSDLHVFLTQVKRKYYKTALWLNLITYFISQNKPLLDLWNNLDFEELKFSKNRLEKRIKFYIQKLEGLKYD